MATEERFARRHTQAVIVIHGIGEERPMDTVRGFVEAVLPEPAQGGEKYFSKPSPLSESFELRKLQNRSQPRTHFFEYYWASKVEGTTFGHVWSWFSGLLFRRPGRLPKQLLSLWYLSWFLLVLFLAAGGLGLFDSVSRYAQRFPIFFVSIASALLLSLLHLVVLSYIGDAARYLSPHPQNIRLRQQIRADGVELLRKIHESGEYERVIVVGHSLGSVIAYDILKNYWQECNELYDNPKTSRQPAMAKLEEVGEKLRSRAPDVSIDDYANAQTDLWKEMRTLGNPWLVTDLITLGSPLAHAALLLADGPDDLRSRQRQRELPTNPPEPELEAIRGGTRPCYSYLVWDLYGKQKNIKLRALHYGGLFACTRWTNLYFPAALGLFGDSVGGPLAPWFGAGIRDMPVHTRNRFRDHTLLAHVTYWARDSRGKGSRAPVPSFALARLIEALNLDDRDTFVPLLFPKKVIPQEAAAAV